MADGKATKLIIPSEIQNLTGLLAAAKEAVTDAEITPPGSKNIQPGSTGRRGARGKVHAPRPFFIPLTCFTFISEMRSFFL